MHHAVRLIILASFATVLGAAACTSFSADPAATSPPDRGDAAADGSSLSDGPTETGAACTGCAQGAACFEGTCDGAHPVSVSAGMASGCAALRSGSGSVWCWGDGRMGQLGAAPDSLKKCGLYPCRARAEKIAALEGAVAVVVGGYFACALKKDGAVWCWGSNANRELGRTTTGLCDAKPCDPVPGVVEGLPPVTQLSLGSDVACARTTSAEVYCWGNGAFGNLGTGGNSTQAPPVKVDGLSSVAEVQLGLHIDGGQGAAACARTTSGGVACWGLNIGGALGHDQGSGGDVVCGTGGSNWCNSAPSLVVPAEKGLTAASITVGVDSACAAQASGPAFCWGRNQQAQLGLAPASLTDNAFVPPTATGASGPRISGRFVNRCVVSYTGALLCWGARHNGEQPAPGEGNVIGLDAGPQSCPVASVPCQPTPPPIGVDAVEDFAGGRMFFLSTKNDGILTGSRVFRSA